MCPTPPSPHIFFPRCAPNPLFSFVACFHPVPALQLLFSHARHPFAAPDGPCVSGGPPPSSFASIQRLRLCPSFCTLRALGAWVRHGKLEKKAQAGARSGSRVQGTGRVRDRAFNGRGPLGTRSREGARQATGRVQGTGRVRSGRRQMGRVQRTRRVRARTFKGRDPLVTRSMDGTRS